MGYPGFSEATALSAMSSGRCAFFPRLRRAFALIAAVLMMAGGGACHLDSLVSSSSTTPTDDDDDDDSVVPTPELVFMVQPANTMEGRNISPAVRVAARDGSGNLLTEFDGRITISIAVNPAGGSLSGNTARDARDGVAVFNGVSINRPGSGYRLVATAEGLVSSTSVTFSVMAEDDDEPEEPARIVLVSGSDQSAVVGASLPTPYVVRVVDGTGSPMAGVEVSFTAGPTSGSVTPAKASTDNAGQAIAVHTLGTVAGAQRVVATTPVVVGGEVAFNAFAAHGPVARLVFGVQPVNTNAGAVIAPPVVIRAEDEFGNTATAATNVVSMQLTPGSGNIFGNLSGTRDKPLAAGVATFDDLKIDFPGADYRLRATMGQMNVDSSPFSVLLPFGGF